MCHTREAAPCKQEGGWGQQWRRGSFSLHHQLPSPLSLNSEEVCGTLIWPIIEPCPINKGNRWGSVETGQQQDGAAETRIPRGQMCLRMLTTWTSRQSSGNVFPMAVLREVNRCPVKRVPQNVFVTGLLGAFNMPKLLSPKGRYYFNHKTCFWNSVIQTYCFELHLWELFF